MAGLGGRLRTSSKLPPEVNRILFVKNLPFKITSEEVYDIFGKYGAIRQVRIGNATETRGTAFVVYEDIFDARNACEHLSGFNVGGRYLSVLYYQVNKGVGAKPAGTLAQQEAEVAALRARVAAGESGASATSEDSLDDDADKRLMKR